MRDRRGRGLLINYRIKIPQNDFRTDNLIVTMNIDLRLLELPTPSKFYGVRLSC